MVVFVLYADDGVVYKWMCCGWRVIFVYFRMDCVASTCWSQHHNNGWVFIVILFYHFAVWLCLMNIKMYLRVKGNYMHRFWFRSSLSKYRTEIFGSLSCENRPPHAVTALFEMSPSLPNPPTTQLAKKSILAKIRNPHPPSHTYL